MQEAGATTTCQVSTSSGSKSPPVTNGHGEPAAADAADAAPADFSAQQSDVGVIAEMQLKFPHVCFGEIKRNLKSAKGDVAAASERIGKAREWRATVGTREAQEKARDLCLKTGFVSVGGHAHNGSRLILVQGACIDTELATAEEYTLALTCVLDDVYPPDAEGKAMILIDVRAGVGWPNPPMLSLLPLVRCVCGTFPMLFPQRMSGMIVFTVPWWAKGLVDMVKMMLEPSTGKKIEVFGGPSDAGAPVPPGLLEFASFKALPAEVAERYRALEDCENKIVTLADAENFFDAEEANESAVATYRPTPLKWQKQLETEMEMEAAEIFAEVARENGLEELCVVS